KQAVEALPVEAGARSVVWDTEATGFGVRVTGAGRTYFVRYRAGSGRGASRKDFSIGKHGAPWTVDSARKQARVILGKVAEGQDPQAEKVSARTPTNGTGFEDVATLFLDRHVRRKLRPSTIRDYESVVLNRLIPEWRNREIRDIRRSDIHAMLDPIEDRTPVMARLTFAVTRRLFGFAQERDLIEDNPCAGLKGPSVPKARDRVLSDDEVKLVWEQSGQMGFPFCQAFRILLLTGQRRSEVGGMMWSELDLEAGEWTIPAERAKNGRAHLVDLAPAVIAEIRSAPMIGEHVLGVAGRSPLQGWSKAKRNLDAKLAEATAETGATAPSPWRIHDLRRTAATGMAGLGFGPHVVERVLNHVSGAQGGLVGVYQRHEYRNERKAALMAWASQVTSSPASNDTNVVDLRTSKEATS
ncbi:MAG: tyrosine-type recombinase/integrase, partial [Minwuia sp.]|nr:tyrosine-type recombinase/integrase [Minwuia sp.]